MLPFCPGAYGDQLFRKTGLHSRLKLVLWVVAHDGQPSQSERADAGAEAATALEADSACSAVHAVADCLGAIPHREGYMLYTQRSLPGLSHHQERGADVVYGIGLGVQR